MTSRLCSGPMKRMGLAVGSAALLLSSGPAGARPDVPGAVADAPDRRGSPTSCAPGPRRLSDMDVHPDGYLVGRAMGEAPHHEFYFARAMYSEGERGGFGFFRGDSFLGDGGPAWSIDYPSADRHMMLVASRLSNLDACEWGQPVSLADPNLRRFPYVYSLEWGYAYLSDEEVEGLRGYLLAGGLLMLDDFWGTYQGENTYDQLSRVLPDRAIVDIPRDHVLFRSHYAIEGDIVQVPGARYGLDEPNPITWQQDGYEPYVRGIFDDEGRLMVAIYANTDLGDALEWAEDPLYPLRYSTFASELFLNTIMYAMTY